MGSRWDHFAQEDAEFFIWGVGTPEEFFRSGQEDCALLIEQASEHLSGSHLAVEVGAGIGRLILPMSARFDTVLALDISPTMLEKLVENCAASGIENVETALISDPWYKDRQADLVYSYTVFQHIESFAEIEGIVGMVAMALGPSGIAALHFDTRRRTLAYRLRAAIPDRLLPKVWRTSIRRIRRNAGDLDRMFELQGLKVLTETDRRSKLHVYLLGRAIAP